MSTIIEQALAEANILDKDMRKGAADLIRELVAEIVKANSEATANQEQLAALKASRSHSDLSAAAIHAIRELLYAQGVPVAAFIDDHVGNAIAQRNMARMEIDNLIQALEIARKLLDEHWKPTDAQGDLEKASNLERIKQAEESAQEHRYQKPKALREGETA